MSKARTRRKKKALQRAQSVQSGSMGSFNIAAQQLMTQMQAQAKASTGTIFSPGLPLNPQPGVTPEHAPRAWSFPLAYNTSGVDRTRGIADIPSFQQLRTLAKLYSGITLPERVWLDMIPGLTLKIGLTPEMKAQGYDDKDFQPEIKKYLKFFEKPDKRLDTHSWLRTLVRSQTQIDEVYVYKRRTRGGELYALEAVDGATMKPLLDDWGRIPEAPQPAYQQYPWGMPGDLFTTDEIIHYQETPQDDSPFGFGRVERFMMEVNLALRKKKRDLAMFTEGNVPQGIMEVPQEMNWTADEIDKFEKLWNSLIAGNVQQQARVKFTYPGMKYIKTDSGEILTDFDYFLYKIACGCYGISLQDIGFVEDIHKSSNEGQQNMLYRRTLQPLVVMYAKLFFTDIIHEDFNDDRFVATFSGYEEEEDFTQQATGYATLAGIGAIAPESIAHIMGLPDVPKVGTFIMGQGGQPIFLKDYEDGSPLREAQRQSQLAGLQFAASNPGGQPNKEEDTDDEKSDGQPQKDEKSSSADAGQTSKDEQKKTDTKTKGDISTTGNSQEKSAPKDEGSLKRAAVSASGDRDNNGSQTSKRAIHNEYGIWCGRAIADMYRGKGFRPFESDVLTQSQRTQVQIALERAVSADDVKAIFRAAQGNPDYNWQDSDPIIKNQMADLQKKGVKAQKWTAHPGACDDCMLNNGKTVVLGQRFPSGCYCVPNHNHCECKTEEIYE